jgi:hypothetical protein
MSAGEVSEWRWFLREKGYSATQINEAMKSLNRIPKDLRSVLFRTTEKVPESAPEFLNYLEQVKELQKLPSHAEPPLRVGQTRTAPGYGRSRMPRSFAAEYPDSLRARRTGR